MVVLREILGIKPGWARWKENITNNSCIIFPALILFWSWGDSYNWKGVVDKACCVYEVYTRLASPVLAWLTIRAWYKLWRIIQARVSFPWCWTATHNISVKLIKGSRPWETKYSLTKAAFSMLLCNKSKLFSYY